MVPREIVQIRAALGSLEGEVEQGFNDLLFRLEHHNKLQWVPDAKSLFYFCHVLYFATVIYTNRVDNLIAIYREYEGITSY